MSKRYGTTDVPRKQDLNQALVESGHKVERDKRKQKIERDKKKSRYEEDHDDDYENYE